MDNPYDDQHGNVDDDDDDDDEFVGLRFSRPSNREYSFSSAEQYIAVPQYVAPQETMIIVPPSAPEWGDEKEGSLQDFQSVNLVMPSTNAIGYNFFPHNEQLTMKEYGVHGGINEGLLFVMIYQAEHLTSLDEKDVDCLVRLSLKRGKKTMSADTKVVKKNSHLPKFFSAFIFPIILGVDHQVEIQVLQKKIFGYTPLASTFLEIDNIFNRPPEKKILPLPLNRRGGSAKIEVLTTFTRKSLSPKAATTVIELEPMRVVLERHIYFAGELVRGVLYVTVRGKNKEIKGLELTAKGKIKYHSSHQESRSNSHGGSSSHTVHDYEVQHIFKETFKVIEKETTLSIGEYVYPFEFYLPPQIPCSGQADTGRCGVRVTYSVSARLVLRNLLKKNKADKIPFKVLLRYVAPQPQIAQSSMTFAFAKGTPVIMKAWLEEQQVFPGVPTKVFVDIHNQSSKEIKKLDLNFSGKISATARGHHKTGIVSVYSSKGDFTAIQSMEKRRFEFEFVVPPKTGATMSLPKAQISWRLELVLRYGVKKSVASIPVVLQPICPEYLNNFPAIPVISTTPKASVSIHISQDQNRKYPWWSFIQ